MLPISTPNHPENGFRVPKERPSKSQIARRNGTPSTPIFGQRPQVELAGVSKLFSSAGGERVTALAPLDLHLPAGTTLLVDGPSGSGKTTLLSLIGCLIRPTSGRIQVRGEETTLLPESALAEIRRRSFGLIFQDHHLIRGLSAIENVLVPAIPCGELNGNLPARARQLLGRLALRHRSRERVEKLSGGERQRVAIARALILDPPVILADEPTAHLDVTAVEDFLDLVEELKIAGKTLIVASHDPLLRERQLFSRRLSLRAGQLVQGHGAAA